MSKLLRNPRALAILALAAVAFFVSVLGGALGEAFGFGFLAGPIPFISLRAEKVASVGGWVITNTNIMFWAAILVLIFIAWRGTRRMEIVPAGMQSLVEVVVEAWVGLVESVGGAPARRFLPLVTTIFLAVLFSNWLGVLPGVGSIGRIETVAEIREHNARLQEGGKASVDSGLTVFDGRGALKVIPFGRSESAKVRLDQVDEGGKVVAPPEGHRELKGKTSGILVPFLRGGSTDLNTTLAIALVAMFAVQLYGFRTLGLGGYGGRFINFKQGPIYLVVGLLEIVSEVSRVISFTFRLFGNMFAGEILLVAMGFLFPLVGIVPFMGMELFVGFIQAIIFSMLALVFLVIATSAHGEEEHAAAGR